MRRSQGLRFALDQRAAAVGGLDPEDHLGGLGSARAQQARQPDNFARPHLKVKWRDDPFFAVIAERGDRLLAQQRAARALKGVGLQLAAQHHFDQLDLRQLAGFTAADKAAVAQHRNAVAHLIHLIEEVGNEDQADALIAQLAH